MNKKQRAFAAANYRSEAVPVNETTGLRLVSHAVQDDTMRLQYMPLVKQWLQFVKDHQLAFNTAGEVDISLSRFLDWGCFQEEMQFSWCSNTWNRILVVFPELRHHLPVAYRAYKAWERRHVAGEGEGIPEEAVFLLADGFRRAKNPEAALIAETSMDVYFRVSEWDQLRKEDIVDDGAKVGLILRVAARGERVKTGRNQDVVLDSNILKDEWRGLRKSLHAGDKASKKTPDQFRLEWTDMKDKLGLAWVGPPHDLRHSGAARDVEKAGRTLEQVRRRGRWVTLESVQKYTKTWLLVKARAKLSTIQMKAGTAIMSERGARTIAE